MYLLFTPTRATDLEDLGTTLVDEQEIRETIASSRSLEPQQV
jgi:hypothetical protein